MASFDAPLEAYQHHLRARHAQLVQEHLDELTARSQADPHQNQATVEEIKRTHEALGRTQASLNFWQGMMTFLTVLFWGGLVICLGGIVLKCIDFPVPHLSSWISWAGVTAGIAWGIKQFWLKGKVCALNQQFAELKTRHHTLLKTAWEQLRPLNLLFTWDTVTDLLRKTLPEVHFDKTFSHQQFLDLTADFKGLSQLTDDFSVCNLQTGHLSGNPFALVKGRTMRMGEKTYSGTRIVSVRKSRYINGKRESYTSFETLYAEITRPCPEYYETSFLLFGSDAAPNLTFTRAPSEHSGKSDTFFNRLAKNRTTKKLEAFSRNLDDEYGFTMMANREFETLFHATDRSDEREFRLLFTPYAQQQMVKLLNDTTIGYGDNFHMIKDTGATLLLPAHLTETDQSLNPVDFWHYDIVEIKRRFITFNADYFKALYFALAPFMTIPLYCQQSPRAERAKRAPKFETSTWESEHIANAYGEKHFKHPESATECILKTLTTRNGDATVFQVTAHSFAAKQHTEYVPKWDSNGHRHNVPVEWIEYRPLRHTQKVIVLPDASIHPGGPSSATAAKELLQSNGYSIEHCHHIRSTYVALL
jgi:hypothetical protein